MEHPNISLRRTGIKYGILTGLAYFVYFFLLMVTGLARMVELHFLTGVILIVGICIAIKNFKQARKGMIDYLEGIGVGFVVGLVSSVIYAFFQVISEYVFNMANASPYRSNDFFGGDTSIWMLAITWIIFGIILGPFIAYLAMQYYKRPDHRTKES